MKHEMEMFGDKRIDDYYWLRDDCRSNPEVLSHLRQENSYTDFIMSGKNYVSHIARSFLRFDYVFIYVVNCSLVYSFDLLVG